ncbi:MAG: two pore domain potassium channel family protein [Oleiphilaceae bacterium]|nr:two pore domain potassium channel family protein [Oleiphilaceae bacterium]
MTSILVLAFALVAVTVLIHTTFLALSLRWISGRSSDNVRDFAFWPLTWLFVRLVWFLLISHTLQIAIWAYFYFWGGALPDLESATYFSGVTYTTIGYGDVLVASPWRIIATIEGLTGIVMCSLSAAFFFSVMTRLLLSRQYRDSDAKKFF